MTDTSLITSTGIIAIVRGDHTETIEALAEALYRGGVRVMEVTLNSPNAMQMIAALNRQWAGKMLIGAGTVLTAEQVSEVAAVGASFCVSPDVYTPVIERALHLGLEPIPGAFTPTEVRTAVRAGARFIKLFPAIAGGPEYLAQIRAPLDDVLFVPTGGVDESNLTAFVRAGAAAAGIGSSLVPKQRQIGHQWLAQVEASAQRLTHLFLSSRTGNA
jgi:2-dehydro-3-deoxyphosphogluconate aldolase/(4S)-4-hydroxy-2-oxoglutarate aldolase